MSAEVISLGPHDRMTADECLSMANLEAGKFSDVIVVGYDTDGAVKIMSSSLSRAEAVFLLLAAIDHARGI